MPIQLQREIESLKNRLLSLAATVEEQVRMAVAALLERKAELARDVERSDADVDRREIEVEKECLRVLALHQPVASDLRLIVAAMRINSDLERIGDLAVNIAHKAAAFAEEPAMDIPVDIAGMGEKTRAMLRGSLDALVHLDVASARSVCASDEEIDRMKHEMREGIEAMIRRDPQHVRLLLRLSAVSRNLERIADCATNIAEDVIYMVDGKVVRHHEE